MKDSQDFQDAEPVRSGNSHVTSRPVSFPLHPIFEGMLRQAFVSPCRREGHLWKIGKRFCKSTCIFISSLSSRIESMEFVNRGAVHTSTAERSERPEPNQDLRCQSGPSAKDSVIFSGGDFKELWCRPTTIADLKNNTFWTRNSRTNIHDKRLRNIVDDYKHTLTDTERIVKNNVNNATHADELSMQHWAHCTQFVVASSDVFTFLFWFKADLICPFIFIPSMHMCLRLWVLFSSFSPSISCSSSLSSFSFSCRTPTNLNTLRDSANVTFVTLEYLPDTQVMSPTPRSSTTRSPATSSTSRILSSILPLHQTTKLHG